MDVDGPGTDALGGLLVPDTTAWREWLAEHHATSAGVWLVLTKKGGTTTVLAYEDALLEALCVGWIDGQTRRRDEGTTFQRFTPRRSRSPWSASNVARVERLTDEGRMLPAGVAAVEAAKADGRWDRAYGGASAMRAAAGPARRPGRRAPRPGVVGRPDVDQPLRDLLPPPGRQAARDPRAAPGPVRRRPGRGQAALPAEAPPGEHLIRRAGRKSA